MKGKVIKYSIHYGVSGRLFLISVVVYLQVGQTTVRRRAVASDGDAFEAFYKAYIRALIWAGIKPPNKVYNSLGFPHDANNLESSIKAFLEAFWG